MDSVTLAFLYKAFIVAVGAFIAWLGYRLYTAGAAGGDLQAKGEIGGGKDGSRGQLRLSGPAGLFFILVGAAIIISATWRGVVPLPAPPIKQEACVRTPGVVYPAHKDLCK